MQRTLSAPNGTQWKGEVPTYMNNHYAKMQQSNWIIGTLGNVVYVDFRGRVALEKRINNSREIVLSASFIKSYSELVSSPAPNGTE